MAHWFDDLAKTLGTRTSRRGVLRLFAAGMAAALVGMPETTRAEPRTTDQTSTYPLGWNLVAGPAGSTLAGATGALYSLQPGDSDYRSFPVTTPLQACWGYWAYFPNGGSLTPGSSSGTCTVAPGGSWV